MADEQTDTQNSQTEATETTQADAAATVTDGGADAAKSGGDDAGDDDSSILGGAEAGDGDGGEDAGKDDGDGEGDQAKADADGPPETYELKLTGKDDEGKDVEIPVDAALLEVADPIFRELNLTNDQANKLAGLVPQIQRQVVQAEADHYDTIKADWAKTAQADEEIGGKNWGETQKLAAKALDHFGAPKDSEFRKLLDESGFGNHPEMIRMFRKIGAAVSEDGDIVRGDEAKGKKTDRTEVLYPDDQPKA